MNKNIQKYIVENISTIIKMLIIYAIGIAIGIILFNITDIKNDYITTIRDILDKTKTEEFESINIIANGIKNNLIFILVSYSSLFTFVAPIILCLILIMKAIGTGIYMCTLFSIFGLLKGVIVIFINVIIPLLFSLSGYILIFTNIISIYSRIINREKIDLKDIIKQVYWCVISLSLISFSIVIEQLMTSVVFNIYCDI